MSIIWVPVMRERKQKGSNLSASHRVCKMDFLKKKENARNVCTAAVLLRHTQDPLDCWPGHDRMYVIEKISTQSWKLEE